MGMGAVEGNCFVRNPMDAQELVQTVRPLAVGCDPLDREWIWQMLWRVERVFIFPKEFRTAEVF